MDYIGIALIVVNIILEVRINSGNGQKWSEIVIQFPEKYKKICLDSYNDDSIDSWGQRPDHFSQEAPG